MLIAQDFIVTPGGRVVVQGIRIVRVHPSRKGRRKLPKGVVSHARVEQGRLLPRLHDDGMVRGVRRSVFLEDNGLPGLLPDEIVLRDPLITPGVIVAPLIGIQVEGAIIEGRDGEVLGKIDTFIATVCVGAITEWWCQPSLIAKSDHVCRVDGFDVCAYAFGPSRDHGGGAAGAARLVAQFPTEDCRGGFVAIDDELDPSLVGSLGYSIGVEGGRIPSVGRCVSVYTTEIIPIIEQRQNDFDTFGFSGRNYVIETGYSWNID